ncbi:unnamed protein product, partial [Dovyalis caffra]
WTRRCLQAANWFVAASFTIPRWIWSAKMMNCGTKSAVCIPKTNIFQLKTALFHSTPVLERKKRNFWGASHRSTAYSRRSRRLNAKETLLRNVGVYADSIFQALLVRMIALMKKIPLQVAVPHGLNNNTLRDPKRTGLTIREPRVRPHGLNNNTLMDPQRTGLTIREPRVRDRVIREGFRFCEDQEFFDVDTLFQSAFGGNQFFYWSFINEETPRWKNSSGYSYNYGRNWRYRVHEDYDSSSEFESNNSESNIASDRLALGLSASGPLKLEDIPGMCTEMASGSSPGLFKGGSDLLEGNLYQCSTEVSSGDATMDMNSITASLIRANEVLLTKQLINVSEQAVAEEKFKLCSAAYQSLCDMLAAA